MMPNEGDTYAVLKEVGTGLRLVMCQYKFFGEEWLGKKLNPESIKD
jgi:hypothetical protein